MRGKYSPNLPTADKPYEYFDRNAYGHIPPAYVLGEDVYNEALHFADYDPDGYDVYGYSAFDEDGDYGLDGIDRNGMTEKEYVVMSDDEFLQYL